MPGFVIVGPISDFFVKATSVFESVYNLILGKVSSSYVPDKSVIEKIEKNRQAFWDMITEDSGIELTNHIRAFCEYDPVTHSLVRTRGSMFAGLKALGITNEEGKIIVPASELLPKLRNFHHSHFSFSEGLNSPMSSDDGPALVHPYDTGFYRPDGTFDAERFANLYKFAIKGQHGNPVISRVQFDACKNYLDDLQWENSYKDSNGLVKTWGRLTRWMRPARWEDASLIDQGVGYVANMGEVGNAFDVLSSELINGIPHASLADLETFYRNTAKIMEDKTSVCIKPKLYDRILAVTCEFAADVVVNTKSYRTGMIINGKAQYQSQRFFYAVNTSTNHTQINPPAPVGLLNR